MSTTEIEKRLTAIERELAQLKGERATTAKSHPIHALEQIHGAFENDEAFREAARLGRQWRESQRPKARKAKAKHK
jgi:hypothetical protein